MSEILLTWVGVREAPDLTTALAEVLAKKAKSKAKSACVLPADCTWTLQTMERVEGVHLGQMLFKAGQPKPVETVDVVVARRVGNTCVTLQASSGRGCWSSGAINPLPAAVIASITEQEQGRVAEQARIAALTPEERRAETERLLGVLRGSPGFFEINVPGRGS
jgi:hypothetical protein